jgi:hypothetical protein
MRRSTAAAGVFVTAALSFGFSGTANAAGDRDCSNFSTQPEAQAFFESAGPGDPHDLDRDDDGMACDSLPGGDSASAGGDGQVSDQPEGAVAAGDGSSSDQGSTLPYVIGGVAMTAAGGAAFAARRSAQQSA